MTDGIMTMTTRAQLNMTKPTSQICETQNGCETRNTCPLMCCACRYKLYRYYLSLSVNMRLHKYSPRPTPHNFRKDNRTTRPQSQNRLRNPLYCNPMCRPGATLRFASARENEMRMSYINRRKKTEKMKRNIHWNWKTKIKQIPCPIPSRYGIVFMHIMLIK